jgi:aminoglycoside phosphotransferase (APT) family kinase protein
VIPTPASLQSWLRRQRGFESVIVDRITQFSGGASNITCKVLLAGGAPVVLRLQRERGIFEPYDVLREAMVLQRLSRSSVPVPAVLGIEADVAVLGAPFALMQFVDAPHMGEAGPEADYAAFTAMVAQIHRLDWRSLDLGFLGVPRSASSALRLELEIVAQRMAAFGCADDSLFKESLRILRKSIPEDGHLALCQGDINVFNYLFRERKVVAVVDWEQARISDPRSDIGQLVALSHLKGAPFCPAGQAGFVRAYESATGKSVGAMEFFRAFWLFQLGVIHEGWVAFNGSSPWYGRAEVDALLSLAIRELQ